MTLDEFEALEKKATPGPWLLYDPYGIVKDHGGLLFYCDAAYVSDQESAKNKAFVCACRDIVPKMIKALRTASAALEDLDRGLDIRPMNAIHRCLIMNFAELEQP